MENSNRSTAQYNSVWIIFHSKLALPSQDKVGHGFFLLIVVEERTSSFSNIICEIYGAYFFFVNYPCIQLGVF